MEPCSLNSIDLNGRFKLVLYKNMAFYLCLFSFIVKKTKIGKLQLSGKNTAPQNAQTIFGKRASIVTSVHQFWLNL
jgi:hypothetical protein